LKSLWELAGSQNTPIKVETIDVDICFHGRVP
jgi:hypothetical protein